MTRRAARITHDEVTRVAKAFRDLGYTIARVIYNGETLELVIGGDNGETAPPPPSNDREPPPLLAEPKL